MHDQVTCPLCGNTSPTLDRHVILPKPYKRYSCGNCEGAFFIPRVPASTEYYQDFPEAAVEDRWEFRRASEAINRVQPSRHLDIGAGNGAFLSQLKVGHRIALEPSTIPPISPDAEDERIADFGELGDLVDSANAFHVLEHVEVPRDFLKQVRKALTSGGRLYMSFPNPSRIEASLYQDKYDLPPNHLNIISRAAAFSMLQQAGFEVEEVMEEEINKSLFRLGSNQFYALIRKYFGPDLGDRLSKLRAFTVLKPVVFAPFILNCALRISFAKRRVGDTVLYVAKAI